MAGNTEGALPLKVKSEHGVQGKKMLIIIMAYGNETALLSTPANLDTSKIQGIFSKALTE